MKPVVRGLGDGTPTRRAELADHLGSGYRLTARGRELFELWVPLCAWAGRPQGRPALKAGHLAARTPRRQAAGGMPTARLNARPNAASES